MKSPVDLAKGSQEESEEKIKFQYNTKHLPYFQDLKVISCLEGNEYDPILKGVYYSLIGIILRDKKIQLGKLKTDTRLSVTIPLPSGQGKKNIKDSINKVLKKLEYKVHNPLTFHSQQLIGKVINRGTIKKPNWIQNKGFLNEDYLIFDEAIKLLTSKDEDIQESRRAIRIAKDLIGQNLVEKKQVDNTFDEEERLSYFPKVTITQFMQPKLMPTDIVEEGDLRRDLVLYVKSIAERDKTGDYTNRLEEDADESKSLTNFTDYLKDIAKEVRDLKFNFTPAAKMKISELHLSLIERGFIHSEKGANFSSMVDFTLQDFLAKLSCCISAMYKKVDVDEAAVELAFMDLLEFFSLQLDYVKDKVKGKLDYGEGWKGARESDQECLEWLYNKGAIDEDSSEVSINEFNKQISIIKKVGYDEDKKTGQAARHYKRFKSSGWVDSKQVGRHDSKVWLTFTPKYVGNKFKGMQDYQGLHAYNTIFSKINEKITYLEDVNPVSPASPKLYEVEDHELS